MRRNRHKEVFYMGKVSGGKWSEEMGDTIKRLAHQILENRRVPNNMQDVLLVGLTPRGVALAGRCASWIGLYSQRGTPIVHHIGDLSNVETSGKHVILVTERLHEGWDVLEACHALAVEEGRRPACIQLLVLVDTGSRQVPVRANYAGMNIGISPGSTTPRVTLAEIDGRDAILSGGM